MIRNNRKTDENNDVARENSGGQSLIVRSLSKRYADKLPYAVEGVSFSCGEGEIVGLLGANGAGKSTTLKCITGMIAPTSGEVRVCGYDISKEPLKAKGNFSFVTDNHAVFVKMTGVQYLSFMADVYGVPVNDRKAKIASFESVFKLGDAVNNLISSYSHGMKQKISMMGSLMHEPKLWLFDEPMMGLDPRTQNSVTSFMRNYVGEGKTILFSSHNLDVVRRLCDKVIVINGGKKVAEITIDDNVRNDPYILNKYYLDEEFQNGAEIIPDAAESDAGDNG